MARRKQTRPTYTVNQVIASNVAKARLLRGWTQQEAADALAPYLGTKMSTASFSAIERSVDGGHVREFDADEVFAFARGFVLPIGWFFTPPAQIENIGLSTPDAPVDGLDPHVLLDSLLGTEETVDQWRQLLLSWPLMTHRVRLHDDGSVENLGRQEDDVHPRLDLLRELRAGMSVRAALGDTDEARHVLLQLADLLAELGDTNIDPNLDRTRRLESEGTQAMRVATSADANSNTLERRPPPDRKTSMKGHTRRRGKTWAFVVDIGTDPATGKRRQKWVSGFELERDAAKAMRTYIARIDQGEGGAESSDTVASYLRDQWLPLRRSKVKQSTWAGYQDVVEGRIIPAIGALALRKVTPKHIANLYDDLLASGSRDSRRGPGLAPKTVRNTGLVLKKAFGDAVRLGLLVRNPTEHVEMPRVERKEMKTWSTEESRQFIAFIRGDRLEALWILMLTSGMRRGEVIGLKWADIDLDNGRLAVRRALVSVGYKIAWSTPKTAKSARVIALDAATCDVLRVHRARQDDEKDLVGDGFHDEDLVFAKPDGSPLHPDYVSQRFGRLVKKAGLPMIRPHDTRHTAATLLLEAGIPVKVVSERLGHSTTSITADLYQHVAPHMQEDAANKLGDMLLGETEPKAEE